MTAQVVGIITAVWGGTTYNCVKGSTLRLPGMRNTAQPAGKAFNYSQQFQPGEAKLTFQVKTGDSLANFMPGSSAELQLQADTGQTWTMPAAVLMDVPVMTDDGGKIPCTFNFGTYSEIVS